VNDVSERDRQKVDLVVIATYKNFQLTGYIDTFLRKRKMDEWNISLDLCWQNDWRNIYRNAQRMPLRFISIQGEESVSGLWYTSEPIGVELSGSTATQDL
jgi:hypothetical protein